LIGLIIQHVGSVLFFSRPLRNSTAITAVANTAGVIVIMRLLRLSPTSAIGLLLSLLLGSSYAQVILNEVSDKGTGSVCEGEDWIEVYNSGTETISLEGYLLFDDKGPLDDGAYSFGDSVFIPADGYLLLCYNGDGLSGPSFKIGGDDQITLRDNAGAEVSTTGILPDTGASGVTYARNASGEWTQTTTPTPGLENQISEPPAPRDIDYKEQNDMGASFFGFTDDGYSVPGTDAVVDLHATVSPADWETLRSNPYTETYIPVEEFKIVGSAGTTIEVLPSPGRLRPRGQSTLVYPICMDEPAIPFKLDFSSTNSSQTLFGIETAYLRSHLNDLSQLSDWTIHRMLARFGLPHLRARHVRFFVNDVLIGFYTMLEAPDEHHVLARTYGYDYDKDHSALYKVKTMSLGCGNEAEYDSKDIGKSLDPSQGEIFGPYAYERGEHRNEVPIIQNSDQCWWTFFGVISSERLSVVENFYDAGYESVDDCGEFLLSHNLVDRDLGKKEWDAPMKDFINAHLSDNAGCLDDACSNKQDLRDKIDVDNWLKTFAVYAVIAAQDSPMGNGNNYYLATAGDSTPEDPRWKMVTSDFNYDPETEADFLCDASCSAKGTENWSVIRPTCLGLNENPLVGPLLLDPELHARYLSYVRQFVESIYTDESFRNELRQQYDAIAKISPDSKTYGPIDASGFFKWMSRRGSNILEQLDLWDNGAFPESAGVNATESCVPAQGAWSDIRTFPDKCTSPDGVGGYDCCASSSWSEPKTCESGYSVKSLEEYAFCMYTCVASQGSTSVASQGSTSVASQGSTIHLMYLQSMLIFFSAIGIAIFY